MKTAITLTALALIGATFATRAPAAETTRTIASAELVFAETGGVIAVEAEHFYKQTSADKRAWHVTSSKTAPDVNPDGDPAHVGGASGGAYLECLPDTRRTHSDKLINGENFANVPGTMAVLHYKVHFNTPGRYYVWARVYSTCGEDNGLHVGLDGQWPESGQRMQWCEGKNSWHWDSKQRTETEHCGEPYKIFLDVAKAGEHEVMFSMREDGFEFDKFILTSNREFARPADAGPEPRVKSGKLPAAFAPVAGAKPVYPASWGTPPQIQTRDLVPLPGGYGNGSSTLAKWIQQNLDKDRPATAALALEAKDFSVTGAKGYYLDKGKWLAINPAQNKSAKAQGVFPHPTGRYHVTLHAVGEEDGKSTFQVAVNDVKVGEFTCPLSTQRFEEGAKFSTTWKNVELGQGDVVTVSSQVASEDGKEFSRARIARLFFEPANATTQAAVKQVASASATPAKPAGPALVQPRKPDGKGTTAITGEMKQWHKVTLTVDGPFANERDNVPNPFTDYALNVTFTHESGSPKYTVPGYFAADGDAGSTSVESGTKWRAHLSPDKSGKWNYSVSFVKGQEAAVGVKGSPLKPFDGQSGSFTIGATDKAGRDFRAKGRLQYVGKHHLQFAGSKEYFLKAGPDSPETMLAYADFDATVALKENVPLKTWQPHAQDWRAGDPTWRDGKGKALIGALNYLAGKGVNTFSFLTYNAAGDGDNVWPFVQRDAKLHYDCSKLDQWGVVFDHATKLGLYLHFKLQENESDDNRLGMGRKEENLPESLDGGKLGPERKLYCRELIARFGHALALNWNIGEENTQTADEVRDMVKFLHDTDPYRHHIVVHTFPPEQELVYRPLLGNKSLLTGVSIQNSWAAVHQRTLQWLRESAQAGRPWVVANDEQNSASLGVPPDPGYQGFNGQAVQRPNPNGKKKGAVENAPSDKATPTKAYDLHDIRKLTLWGNLMAGGAGVEYYFGYQLLENDLVCQDFRSRDKSWDYCRIALDFFHTKKIPFAEMKNANALIGNAKNENSKFCFAKAGEVYLVYLPNGGTTELDLAGANGSFTVKWFNPRTGGPLKDGSVKSVKGGGTAALGNPPADVAEDWLIVVRR